MSLVDQGLKLDGYRVLIVGCGQLGSRHLQAVASLPLVREIEIVDPRPQALELGRERVAEVRDRQHSTDIRWLSSLSEATPGGDLCIIATLAQGRCQLVREVVETLGYSSFILEKLATQSVREMEDLEDFSRVRGLSAWVNCQTRTHPFHRRVKQRLDPRDPINFSVLGGKQKLASNGIHVTDLFTFYDENLWIKSGGSYIDPILYPSKRGDGLFDLSGTLLGCTEKGSRLTIHIPKIITAGSIFQLRRSATDAGASLITPSNGRLNAMQNLVGSGGRSHSKAFSWSARRARSLLRIFSLRAVAPCPRWKSSWWHIALSWASCSLILAGCWGGRLTHAR